MPGRIVVVIDADLHFERPTTPEQGEIVDVDFEYRNVVGEGSFRGCQACSKPIHYADVHAVAIVRIQTKWTTSRQLHICDADSWWEWAFR